MNYTLTICGRIEGHADSQERAEHCARFLSNLTMMTVHVNTPNPAGLGYIWAATYTDGKLSEQRKGAGFR